MSSSSSSSSSCSVNPTSFFTQSSQPGPFATTLAMERFHRATPRFGHSNNINDLLQGSNNEKQADYLKGLLAASTAIFCLVVLWTIWLLATKWCCCQATICGGIHHRKALKCPPKPKLSKPKRKMPFQHNGVAAGHETTTTSNSHSPMAKKIKDTITHPIQAAREKKRRLEEQHGSGGGGGAKKPSSSNSKSSKYSKMKSTADLLDDIDEGGEDHENEQAPKTALESALSPAQSKQSTVPTTMLSVEEGGEHESYSTPMTNPSGAGGTGAGSGTIITDGSKANNTIMSSSTIAAEIQLEKDKRQAWNTYYEKLNEYQKDVDTQALTVYRLRLILMMCFIGIIIASILFVVMGMLGDGLASSVVAVKDGLNQMSTICSETIIVIDNYQMRQSQAVESTQKFILEVNALCPSIASSLCVNVTSDDDRQCDFSQLPIGDALVDLFRFFNNLSTTLFQSLDDMKDDLLEVISLLDLAQTYYPKHFGWAFWVAAGGSLGLTVVCLYLLAVVVRLLWFTETEMTPPDEETMASSAVSVLPLPVKGIRSWLILPLLIFLTFVSWLFSMVFIVGSIGTADLCVNSPDGPMLTILDNINDSLSSSLVPLFLAYYVRGCPSPDDPDIFELDRRVGVLSRSVLPAIEGLANSINNTQTASDMEFICGAETNYLLPFLAITKALESQFCVLTETLDDIRALFACENWYPVYEETVHNAICYHANSGLAWASATQFAIVVLVLVVLTFRVGYYEFDEITNPSASTGCCGGNTGAKNLNDDDDEQSTSDGEHD